MEKKYICIRDYQGTDFAVGEIHTAEEWGKKAISWADTWDEEPYTALMKIVSERKNDRELIEYICDTWEILIVEYRDIKQKWFDKFKFGRIKEFRLLCETDEWFEDLIIFDHYVEWADVVDIVQYVKTWPDYYVDDIYDALGKLCSFTSKWIGDDKVLYY